MTSAYEVRRARILSTDKVVLEDLNLDIPDRAVTVLLGPGGVGKTSLLLALSGRRLPDGLRAEGVFRHRGVPRTRWNASDITFVPQQRTGEDLERTLHMISSASHTVLIDEPFAGARSDRELEPLVHALSSHSQKGASVVVTHSLALARAVADHVGLLCAGRVDSFCTKERFFSDPPSDLAVQFVRAGNCWPKPKLPSHFHWVEPRLAGMGRPGLLNRAEADIAAIAASGIDHLITLTEAPPLATLLGPHGITSTHFPIPDMGVPELSGALALCRGIAQSVQDGASVVVHCEAGLGRTGTVLACVCVLNGMSPERAVAHVRKAIRGAIQTQEQEQFVHAFADQAMAP